MLPNTMHKTSVARLYTGFLHLLGRYSLVQRYKYQLTATFHKTTAITVFFMYTAANMNEYNAVEHLVND